MQEWLTVIIVLLIVAVVLDGLRRMRQSRRSTIRMSRNVSQQSPAAVDDVKDYGSELPSGGARVVNVRKAQDAVERNVQIRQSAEQKRRNQLKSFRIPEQVSLNLDQKVPTLMESVAEEKGRNNPVSANEITDFNDDDRIEPVFTNDEEIDEVGLESTSEYNYSADDDYVEDYQNDEGNNFVSDDELDEWDKAGFSDGSHESVRAQKIVQQAPAQQSGIPSAQRPNQSSSPMISKPAKPREEPVSKQEVVDEEQEEFREPELVLVINVMAHKGQQFPGAELLDIILNQGLRFGTMNIFHRHEEDDGDGEILYSMANIVVPGTFELAKMKTFSTPGVSLFMTLPMDANSIEAFEDMLTTAKIIAARLGGELKDENRSVLTPQTITHYRSKLQEFVRKQLSKAPA